ncbi:type I-E CRISPR-associated protein Cse2/CasB [Streptomyces sp. 184]|uniref:type I-E CRISPR-associated protein Cse2/CasB n=1 Tax=Streptomyces sp. 184 TaxID=1827526 RepID=UPI0038918082
MTDTENGAQSSPEPGEPAGGDARWRRYWNRYLKDGRWRADMASGPPGEELAALRAGLGETAMAVPAMWPYYTCNGDGAVTPALEAEHGALALFGLHQQSQSTPMHKQQVGVGQALHALRAKDRFSPEALDRRVAATVESERVGDLLFRLRMLVPNLRAAAVPLDYDRLMWDLCEWRDREGRQKVRRRWGLQYYVWEPHKARSREKSEPDA